MARKNLLSTTVASTLLLLGGGLQTACDSIEDGRDGDVWTQPDDGDEPGGLPADAELPPISEIYGGTDVATCGWPTTVELGGACTGTLVHERVVIYAAPCGADYDSVRLGESINGGPGRWVDTQQCRSTREGVPGTATTLPTARWPSR